MRSTLAAIAILAMVWVCCVSMSVSAAPLSSWLHNDISFRTANLDHMQVQMQGAMEGTTPQQGILTSTDGEALPVYPISGDGSIAESPYTGTFDTPTSVGMEFDAGDGPIHKIVQVLPDSRVIASPDGSMVMQVSQTEPALQIYYGYQQSPTHPFTYLYKVDSISAPCRATKVTFETRNIERTPVSCDAILAIMSGDAIPAMEALP